jgi:hypothetical protein
MSFIAYANKDLGGLQKRFHSFFSPDYTSENIDQRILFNRRVFRKSLRDFRRLYSML